MGRRRTRPSASDSRALRHGGVGVPEGGRPQTQRGSRERQGFTLAERSAETSRLVLPPEEFLGGGRFADVDAVVFGYVNALFKPPQLKPTPRTKGEHQLRLTAEHSKGELCLN
jgi:hypothetical protein